MVKFFANSIEGSNVMEGINIFVFVAMIFEPDFQLCCLTTECRKKMKSLIGNFVSFHTFFLHSFFNHHRIKGEEKSLEKILFLPTSGQEANFPVFARFIEFPHVSALMRKQKTYIFWPASWQKRKTNQI